MKKQAFTLIELLVVVLIIGILAAVAVPQYKRVITRAHNREAILALRTAGRGIELYNLANGPLSSEYTRDFSKLDVEIRPSAYWDYAYFCLDEFKSCHIWAHPKKDHGVNEPYYELNLDVEMGEMDPYIEVIESETTDEWTEGDTTYVNSTSKNAGPEICKKAAGTMDEKHGCIIM